MKDRIIEFVAALGLAPELLTAILSMLPVTELRAAIPVAHGLFGLSLPIAFFWAFLGSLVPGILILWGGHRLIAFAQQRDLWFSKAIWRKIEKTRKKFSRKYERHGEVGLVAFVAVPLPLTGVWTGSIAAVLFGIPFRRALPLIAVGNAIAGMLVTLATAGIFNLTFIL